MNRPTAALCLLALAAALAGCGGSGSSSSGGGASADALMTMIPVEATGVFHLDMTRILSTPVIKSALEDKSNEIQEFTEATGLQLDDITAVMGFVTSSKKDSKDGGFVVTGNGFDQDRLLARAREKDPDTETTEYEGVTMARMSSEEKDGPAWVAFLDSRTLAFGRDVEVKQVIDVRGKRSPSMKENRNLMDLVGETETTAMAWGAFAVSEEAAGTFANQPMMDKLEGLRSLTLMADYDRSGLQGQIRIQGSTPQKTQEIAGFLNMITGFMAMGAAENPDLGELLKAIEIDSDPEYVSLNVTVSEDLLTRLMKVAEKKDSAALNK